MNNPFYEAHTLKNRIHYSLIAMLVLAYPTFALLVKGTNSLIFFALVLLGIIAYFTPKTRAISREEKLVASVFFLFFAVSVLSWLLNGMHDHGFKELGRHIRLALVIFVIYLLVRSPIDQKWFWIAITIGAISTGLYSIWHLMSYGIESRVGGATNPIIFGDETLILAFISLAAAGYFAKKSKWLLFIPLIAFLLGLTASFLSQTRGAWIAIPALVLILAVYVFQKTTVKQKLAIGLTTAVMLGITVIGIGMQSNASQRIEEAILEAKNYLAGERGTSVGTRLEQWVGAWDIFKANPILGAGTGSFQEEARIRVELGQLHPSVAEHTQPHNEYLLMLSSRGLIGFLALLALFLVPARIYFQAIKSDNKDISRLGLAGLIVIVGYMHFGLTETILNRTLSINFFVFLNALIVFLIIQIRIQQEQINQAEKIK